MARQYKRDARGRFAGGGGGGKGGRPAANPRSKGSNRLTRDNAGRITSVGGSGATARGGRLKTASGKQRATVKVKARGGVKGTVGKPKGLKPGTLKPKAATRPAVRKIASQADFATMKRRYDRTKPENSGLKNNIDDRRGGMGPSYQRRLLNSMSTRGRALKVYRGQSARPLYELPVGMVRAPFGKFSTVSNPAPAKAFPSQAPGRTKKAESLARENRKKARGGRRR